LGPKLQHRLLLLKDFDQLSQKFLEKNPQSFVLILSFSLGLGVFAFATAGLSVTMFFFAVTFLTPQTHFPISLHPISPTAIMVWQARNEVYLQGYSNNDFVAMFASIPILVLELEAICAS